MWGGFNVKKLVCKQSQDTTQHGNIAWGGRVDHQIRKYEKRRKPKKKELNW